MLPAKNRSRPSRRARPHHGGQTLPGVERRSPARGHQLGGAGDERTAETLPRVVLSDQSQHAGEPPLRERKEARRAADRGPQHRNDLCQGKRIEIGGEVGLILGGRGAASRKVSHSSGCRPQAASVVRPGRRTEAATATRRAVPAYPCSPGACGPYTSTGRRIVCRTPEARNASSAASLERP